MSTPRPAEFRDPRRRRLGQPVIPIWVRVVIVICVLIELGQIAVTMAGYPLLRHVVTGFGAFWSGMLWGTNPPFFPGQNVTMFLSYGLLHAGIAHLAMNMISLAAVARELARMVAPWQMAAIYLLSQIFAALVYAAMVPVSGPMVGASGAIFGVAGALVGMVGIRLYRRGGSLGQLGRGVALILVLNIAITILLPSIAWEAHLGGGIAGLVMGAALALWQGRP